MNADTILFDSRWNASTDSGVGLETDTSLASNHKFDFFQEMEASPSLKKPRTVRRLEGILLSIDGDEARVCFVQNDQPLEMLIPSHYLKKNGIIERYQPFEFSEQEVYCNGYWQQAFLYKPLCESQKRIRETLALSEESMEKLCNLLRK